MKKFIALFVGGLTAALLLFGVAIADTVVVTGTGTWDGGATATAYSESSATWSFTFNLPSTIGSNPTTEATDFSYLLNGSSVAASLSTVMFYEADAWGLFDLNFADGSIVSFMSYSNPGDDVGSSFTLLLGTFDAQISTLSATGTGTVTLSPPEPNPTPSPVPEPSTMLLFGAGLAGLIGLKKKHLG